MRDRNRRKRWTTPPLLQALVQSMQWLDKWPIIKQYLLLQIFLNLDGSLKLRRGRITTRPDIRLPSRVRLGRGSICGHLIFWARAVRPKTAKPPKNKVYGRTDGPTKRAVESRSTRLKTENRGGKNAKEVTICV